MPFVKGQSGNPGGRSTEKEFYSALRAAINQTDAKGRRKLHLIAEKLVESAINGESWAIQQVADRLDGRPAQDTTLTIEKRDATDWSFVELVAFLREETANEERVSAQGGSAGELDQLH